MNEDNGLPDDLAPDDTAGRLTMRCATCGRFRLYHVDDQFCLICGHDPLERACSCGRDFDYALAESGDLHCPRCGRTLRGRASEYE
jgi:ribosomal protein L37E